MNNNILQEIYEVINFLKDNMVSKEDAKAFLTKEDGKSFASKDDIFNLRNEMHEGFVELRSEIKDTKNELLDHIDGFTKSLNKYESENSALRSGQQRTEVKVDAVINHFGLDIT